MGNLRNNREYREAVLTALGMTEDRDVENGVNFKSALLEALGVEHTRSDVVNFETYREKLIEGVTNYSGGGSSDFSTATMIVNGDFTQSDLFIAPLVVKDPNNEDIAFPKLHNGNSTYTVILYKGRSTLMFMGNQSRTITVSGNIETIDTGVYIITGDCTINLIAPK